MEKIEALLKDGWIILKIDFARMRPIGSKYYMHGYYRDTGLTATGYGETLLEAVSDFLLHAGQRINADQTP